MQYFLYKLIQIPEKGAVQPPAKEGVDLGLAKLEFGEWFLGATENEDYLERIPHFHPYPVDDDFVEGLAFIKTDVTRDNDGGLRPLNSVELEKKEYTISVLTELRMRNEYRKLYGDETAQCHSLYTRIVILERIVLALYHQRNADAALSSDVLQSLELYAENDTIDAMSKSYDEILSGLKNNSLILKTRYEEILDEFRSNPEQNS